MTLLDVEELSTYWTKHPPVHVLVAAYLGVGVEKKKSTLPPGFPPVLASDDGAIAEVASVLGMGDRSVYEGFAVQEIPRSFEDLKRLNGL